MACSGLRLNPCPLLAGCACIGTTVSSIRSLSRRLRNTAWKLIPWSLSCAGFYSSLLAQHGQGLGLARRSRQGAGGEPQAVCGEPPSRGSQGLVCFAFPQSFWKDCGEHLTLGVMIVVCRPVTELQQSRVNQWYRVKYCQSGFQGFLRYITVGLHSQQVAGDLAPPKGYAHARAWLQSRVIAPRSCRRGAGNRRSGAGARGLRGEVRTLRPLSGQ